MQHPIRFILNGQPVAFDTDDDRTLLWVVRTGFALTGRKYGCGQGFCGACTVIVGGTAVRSCVMPIGDVEDKEVVPREGLAQDGGLHPLQKGIPRTRRLPVRLLHLRNAAMRGGAFAGDAEAVA